MNKNEFEKIETLLNQVSGIRQKAYEEAEKKGENFNIFQVLKLETKEVELHTRLILNLLQPNGKHGLGTKPLEYFIRVINNNQFPQNKLLENIDFKKAQISNKYLGVKSRLNEKNIGGDIDIFIKTGQICFAIENKINASDQNEQLIRYYNSLKIEKINFLLFYLTLEGKSPSHKSVKDKLKEGGDYFLLSYKEHIKSWLELCLEAANKKPILRETLRQYIISIKKLTGQLTNQNMKKEVINLIIDNYEAGKLINDNWEKVLEGLRLKVMVLVKEELIKSLHNDKLEEEIQINENEKFPALSIRGKEWGQIVKIYLESKKSINKGFQIGLIKSFDYNNITEIKTWFSISNKLKEYSKSSWIYKQKKIEIEEFHLKNLDSIVSEISLKIKELFERVDTDWNNR